MDGGRQGPRAREPVRLPDPSPRALALLDRTAEAFTALRRAYAEVVAVVHALDAEQVAAETGYLSVGRLLQDHVRADRGEVRVLRRHAALLCPTLTPTGAECPPMLPATAALLGRGLVGDGHVRVVAEVMRRLDRVPHLDPDTLRVTEAQLAGLAADRTPKALADAATEIADWLDPDGAAPTDDHAPTDELHLLRRRDGSLAGTFRYADPVAAEAILVALRAATPPATAGGHPDDAPASPPAVETGQDATGQDATGRDATGRDATGRDATGRDATGRTLPERQAQALRDLIADAITRGVDADDAAEAGAEANVDAEGDDVLWAEPDLGAGAGRSGDETPAESGDRSGPVDADDLGPDDLLGPDDSAGPGRPQDSRACRGRAVRPVRAGTEGGERVHVAVTIDWELLSDGHTDDPAAGSPTGSGRARRPGQPRLPGTGRLDSGARIGPETARRLACDAEIIPIVLGSRSEPLDVGRRSRAVSPAIRNALVARDHHCAFPGCRRHARRCEAHHIRHWALGGPTAVLNLALLCPYHHSLVHHGGWIIRMTEGLPWFVPPRWIDPDRTPRHNRPWRHDQPPCTA